MDRPNSGPFWHKEERFRPWHIGCSAASSIVTQMNTVERIDLDLPMPRNEDVIHLPLGLLGFERFKEYLLVESPEEAPFRWLQALDDPALTFLVIPLMDVIGRYEPNISDEDVAFLRLNSPQDAIIFGIVTLRPQARATVNLKGPIILNRHTFRGKQVVLANAAQYPLRYPLPTAEETDF